MKKYLFVFDMGNVVSAVEPLAPKVSEALGIKPFSEEKKKEFYSIFAAATRGNISSMEALKISASREGPPEPKENYWKTFFDPKLIESSVRFIEDIKKQGYRAVCGTNTIDVHYQCHVEKKDYNVFDKVYASNLMGHMKPDVTFWMAIKEAEKEYAYEDIFFFDDLEENVKAASSLGINAHLFTNAENASRFVKEKTGLDFKF